MTDAEIEAVARALCERQIRIARRFDTSPDELEAMLPASVDVNWPAHYEDARAAIAALDRVRAITVTGGHVETNLAPPADPFAEWIAPFVGEGSDE